MDEKPVDLVSLIEEPAWKTILIDLVKREKMNVWSINLVELAEKYLQRIKKMQSSTLKIPANAILACAILLKLKSKTISFSFLKEEKEPEISEEEIKQMEEMLPELTPITKVRERKVSLNELMEQIEAVIDKTKQRSEKYRRKKATEKKPSFVIPAFDEKDLEDKIEEVFNLVLEKSDQEGLVLFSDLVKENAPVEVIDTFVPLLFLANKQRLTLWQESFFGEIFVSVPKN